ncbi:hypothetical protein L9F63_012946, partial [Diploptera punctata]
ILSQKILSKFIWLIFLKEETDIKEFFRNVNISFDCEFLVAQREDGHFVLTEVYRISATLPLETYRFGTWSSTTGLDCSRIGLYRRRNNLGGLVLPTAVTMYFIGRGRDFPSMNFGGRFFAALNFNGKWNGILGMMQRGEVNFSCINFLMTPARLDIVDFLTPISVVRTSLNIRDEKNVRIKWTEFFRPFCLKLWIVEVSVMLLIVFCLLITHKIGRHNENGYEPEVYSFGEALFCTLA